MAWCEGTFEDTFVTLYKQRDRSRSRSHGRSLRSSQAGRSQRGGHLSSGRAQRRASAVEAGPAVVTELIGALANEEKGSRDQAASSSGAGWMLNAERCRVEKDTNLYALIGP